MSFFLGGCKSKTTSNKPWSDAFDRGKLPYSVSQYTSFRLHSLIWEVEKP